MKLNNFITKLKSVPNSSRLQLLTIVNNHGSEIVEFNKENLAKGDLNSDGVSDGRSYSKRRIGERNAHNPKRQTDFVDLNFKGKFYDSIRYKKTKTGGKITSVDRNKEKIQDIDDRYGEDVLGIDEKNLETVAQAAAIELSVFIANKISS